MTFSKIISGVSFYLRYGENLFEVLYALNPLERPFFWQITLCCISAIISGFGLFSILLKLKSVTPFTLPSLLYYSFAVII